MDTAGFETIFYNFSDISDNILVSVILNCNCLKSLLLCILHISCIYNWASDKKLCYLSKTWKMHVFYIL